MELKKSNDSQLTIIVNKTTFTVNPTGKNNSSRVLIFSDPAVSLQVPTNPDQLVISGPGEYEVDNITIQALTSVEDKNPSYLYTLVQDTQNSLLILPVLAPIPDSVVEKIGAAQVLAIPYTNMENTVVTEIAKVIKQLNALHTLVITAEKAFSNTTSFQELSPHLEVSSSNLKLKQLKAMETETLGLYILTAS